jgi:hypothetical protein
MPVSGATGGATKVGAIRRTIRPEIFRHAPGKQALLISLNQERAESARLLFRQISKIQDQHENQHKISQRRNCGSNHYHRRRLRQQGGNSSKCQRDRAPEPNPVRPPYPSTTTHHRGSVSLAPPHCFPSRRPSRENGASFRNDFGPSRRSSELLSPYRIERISETRENPHSSCPMRKSGRRSSLAKHSTGAGAAGFSEAGLGVAAEMAGDPSSRGESGILTALAGFWDAREDECPAPRIRTGAGVLKQAMRIVARPGGRSTLSFSDPALLRAHLRRLREKAGQDPMAPAPQRHSSSVISFWAAAQCTGPRSNRREAWRPPNKSEAAEFRILR